jgi:hypothetical protein
MALDPTVKNRTVIVHMQAIKGCSRDPAFTLLLPFSMFCGELLPSLLGVGCVV